VLAAAAVLAIAVNRWLLPVLTGWSLGRAVFGIAVQDRDGGEAPGSGRLALRDLAHVLDTVPMGLGWLWPLLDARGRTFADMLVRTEVREVVGPRPDRRKAATIAIAVAAALAVLLAGLGYATVYHHQQSLARVRAQIADEGPNIVTDMLSYTVKTAQDDFARAQTLVTDGYRPELVQQQEAVKKNGLVDNDYWVSNSSVLSSSADQATMLLLLQGQRGAAPKQRFVTASLRVEYQKVGDAWKVSNLTVLSAPKPAAPAPAPESPAPKDAPAPKPEPAKPSAGGR
jgi:Mce-associated membrane protein